MAETRLSQQPCCKAEVEEGGDSVAVQFSRCGGAGPKAKLKAAAGFDVCTLLPHEPKLTKTRKSDSTT